MRIALTGATGLLGRNLLFEILKQNLSKLDDLEILVLGRSLKNYPLKNRLKDIIADDGYAYIGIDANKSQEILKIIDECIVPIPFDLSKDKLGISAENMEILKRNKIDYFFHLAALSDFRMDKNSKKRLENINIQGTKRILELLDQLKVKEAIYTGSAYSCGTMGGLVNPDYVNLRETFRNYYEESKLIAEDYFRKYAIEKKLKYRVFRPVGICGRLIEKPIGSICKYDLFYGWAAFFLKEKLKIHGSFEGIYKKSTSLPIRITCNLEEGLNVVPADYAAKIIYAVCMYDDPGKSYHIINNKEIANKIYLPLILDELNIEDWGFIAEIPANKNHYEKLYYKTVGKIFTPYLIFRQGHFSDKNLANIYKKNSLRCPAINIGNTKKLLAYAKKHYFGLEHDNVIAK